MTRWLFVFSPEGGLDVFLKTYPPRPRHGVFFRVMGSAWEARFKDVRTQPGSRVFRLPGI